MNQVIETILAHRSVRQFTEEALTTEQIELIVRSAQAASTSSFIQPYTIIGVTDYEVKRKLAEIAGNQSYVANNGYLFVFCADFYRHEVIGEMEEAELSSTLESTEKFMVALIDTALAAQNAAIAAESLGLGICYIGGLRNHLEEVCQLLETPQRVIPLFALVVGYPVKLNEQKPRLPLHHVFKENKYEANQEKIRNDLHEYNDIIHQYYHERTAGKRGDTWTNQMAKTLGNKVRMYMNDFVKGKGFNKQ
ncbi:oxygen-insensitive NADPH nitroreductase [Bacillus kwashiorkori]|uniref:oxygen-insensitive NADPH nitroreductase n=1 Tax=Bacillus kwashiorkori TaxID=1522318 RepID=UPI00078600B8|nr:oxygen-insensitive NADPH nitroreductase [Bacillus kwashiorkori]